MTTRLLGMPRGQLLATLTLAATACACGELLGARVTEATDAGGTTVDASVDAAPEGSGQDGGSSNAALLINPSEINFVMGPPAMGMGTPGGTTMTAQVVNVGTAPSPPLSATILQDTTDFLVSGSTCSASLQPDAGCSVTLTQVGTPAGRSGVLRVGGDGVYAFASVLGPPPTGLNFSPQNCTFMLGDAGSAPPCQFTLTNGGSLTLPQPAFMFAPVSAGLSITSAPCPSSFPPGATCPVSVAFSPSFESVGREGLIATAGPETTSATLIYMSPPAPPPPGTLLIGGTGRQVLGATRDGHVLASTPSGTLMVPISGGNPTLVLPPPFVPVARVVDDTMFLWSGPASGGLMVLNTANVMTPGYPSAQSSLPIFAAADDQVAVILNGWNSATATADLLTLALPAHPITAEVFATASLAASPTPFDPCTPTWQATTGGLVVGACVGGTGPFSGTLWSLDTSGNVTTIATGVSPSFSADAAGDSIFVVTSSGQGQVLSTTGSLVATIDTGVTQGAMLPSGAGVVYVASGALRENTVPPTTPTTLASKATGLWALSPSGAYALYYDAPLTGGSPLGPTGDVLLVQTGGTPTRVTLTSTQTAVPWAFTADESHVSWVVPAMGATSYATTFASTATGAALAGSPLLLDPQGLPQNGAGALVVYQVTDPSSTGPSLHALDTVKGTDVLLYSPSRSGFALSGTEYVYSTDVTMAPGVYAAPLP